MKNYFIFFNLFLVSLLTISLSWGVNKTRKLEEEIDELKNKKYTEIYTYVQEFSNNRDTKFIIVNDKDDNPLILEISNDTEFEFKTDAKYKFTIKKMENVNQIIKVKEINN